jgi:hypothetical protein
MEQDSKADGLVDQRDPGFFIVDDEVIDEYGAKIGPLGIAVYNVLVKHANKFGASCFPSYQTIADKLGISRNSAMKGVEILVAEKLVRKDRREDSTGAPKSNDYKILPVKKGKKQPSVAPEKVVQILNHPPDLSDAGSAEFALPSSDSVLPLVQILHQGSAEFAPELDPSNQTPLNQIHTHTAPPPKVPPNGKPECVCETPHRSKICDDERIRIATNTEGIHSPERYAMTLEARRGTYDTVFLKRQRQLEKPGVIHSPQRDVSNCPDCRGSGWWYPTGDTPEGRAQGTAKCKHSRLDDQPGEVQAGISSEVTAHGR